MAKFVLPISFEPPKDFKVREYFYGFTRQKTEVKVIKDNDELFCFINDKLITLDQALNYQGYLSRQIAVTKYSKAIEDEFWEIDFFYFEKADNPYFVLATCTTNNKEIKHMPFKKFLLEIPELTYNEYTIYALSDVNATLAKLKGLYNDA